MDSTFPPPIPEQSHFHGNEKVWVLLSHLSIFLGFPFLLPFIIYLAMKKDSPRVAYHAKESLNFHLSCLLYAIISFPVAFLMPILLFLAIIVCGAIGLFGIIFAIVAAVKSSDGVAYRYPMTIRFF